LKRCGVSPAFLCDDFGRRKLTFAQLYAAASVAHVEPQRDSYRVHLPEAERAPTRRYAVAMSHVTVRGEEIPGHNPVARKAAPLQIAVRPLLVIAQKLQGLRQRAGPSQMHAGERGLWGLEW
jgi:hypothetical protein